MPVAAAETPGDPGHRLGQEAEAPGGGGTALVEVREQRHACGKTGQRACLGQGHVQEEAGTQAGHRAGQGMRMTQHQPCPLARPPTPRMAHHLSPGRA